MRANLAVTASLCAWCAVSPVLADLYSQDFEVDSTASWTMNSGPSDAWANFFFDYSTVGIPPAPSAPGTRGMKLQANLANGIFSGMSVSPTGQSFPDTYTVEFDWWANFNGPFPLGGSGSTNLSTFGVGTSGITPQWPAGFQDSVWFAATGDGNSSADWRAYSSAAPPGYPDGSPVYPFATRDNTDPYFAGFGANTAPPAQLALFPQQTGTTVVGSAGMEWHHVVIDKTATVITWTVDGTPMATIDPSTVTLGGANIFFGHSDVNASSSTDPFDADLLFTLIDNIHVVPGPGAACPGDLNCDGQVDFGDINPFVLRLSNPGAYTEQYPGCPDANGDVNGDGTVGFPDINPFVQLMSTGQGPCP